MEIVIKPGRRRSDLREIWANRELFYFLAWRDFKVRYKQTLIGAAWAIFQPLLLMVVFTLFFNKVAGISSPSGHYPIFAYTGLLFWNFFGGAMQAASNSLVGNQAVVTKVYFPRLIAPLSATLVTVVDFLCASSVYVALMVYYRVIPGMLGVLLVVPMLLITWLAGAGLGTWLAALNVKYRDVRQILPFFIQALMFVTPVIYALAFVPDRFREFVYLNPMAGVITAMRAELIHQGSVAWSGVAISAAISVLLFAFGVLYFERAEAGIADII
ncbi:MAG TPA: ABC transporter permease [Gaiellaceae bacterium]